MASRMPAEWERHEATWIAWPHNRAHWGRRLARIEKIFLQMIAEIACSERVHLVVKDSRQRRRAARLLAGLRPAVRDERIRFFEIPNADVWVRDYAPVFVKTSRGVRCVKWIFNAWGGKYPDLRRDDTTGTEMARRLGLKCVRPGIVLEGGSIDSDGRGTCLTTEQCLLNPNRNPRLARGDIEKILRKFLGFRRFIWLQGGIAGDDTDGHVDDVARFAGPRTVFAALACRASDPNFEVLNENFRRLRLARGPDGKRFRIVPLPMPAPRGVPRPVLDGDDSFAARRAATGASRPGRRAPASYANFFISNGSVLVPTFGDPHEAEVLSLFKKVFRGRRVVGIRSDDLVRGRGALHCVTQQQPRGESTG